MAKTGLEQVSWVCRQREALSSASFCSRIGGAAVIHSLPFIKWGIFSWGTFSYIPFKCMNHRQYTHHSGFDKPVKQLWWLCDCFNPNSLIISSLYCRLCIQYPWRAPKQESSSPWARQLSTTLAQWSRISQYNSGHLEKTSIAMRTRGSSIWYGTYAKLIRMWKKTDGYRQPGWFMTVSDRRDGIEEKVSSGRSWTGSACRQSLLI
jgi:hypothetical protein